MNSPPDDSPYSPDAEAAALPPAKSWRFSGKELLYVKEVLDSGFGASTSGSMNQRFERAFAATVGTRFAVTSNSGTSTLQQALAAAGVGYGDEVIQPPLTVISNVGVTLAQNAVPVFADIDADTFNIDPEDVARKITPKTKAIMPVSLYGLSADLDPLMALAEKHGLIVINDAAEAHMSTYKGRNIAQCAHVTSYSTENSKQISTGDGGILVTDDEMLAAEMRKFGSLGFAVLSAGEGRIRLNKDVFQDPDYQRHDAFGMQFRMPEVAAALGLAQTERIDWFIDLRIRIAKLYEDAVNSAGGDYLVAQKVPDGYESTYWCWTCKYMRDDVPWKDFRRKNVELGGDGIYAAWALAYKEALFTSGEWKKRAPPLYGPIDYLDGTCPVAEEVQPRLMQFVNNYGSVEEAEPKAEALHRTIRHFA